MVTETKPVIKALSDVEQKAVADFLARVRSKYGARIQQAMLFGSKARGEATVHSDIDVALILADETWEIRDDICKVSADISLQYDVLLDARVFGAARWNSMRKNRAGLYQNISGESIPLAV
jgi:predicted nucleotidyltransferase